MLPSPSCLMSQNRVSAKTNRSPCDVAKVCGCGLHSQKVPPATTCSRRASARNLRIARLISAR
eukprot:2517771-Prymnesium_polylepis.2